MVAIKHILFPVDFSDRSTAAIPFVTAMATRFGSKVTVISAVQPFYYGGMGDPGLLVMVDTDALIAELKTRLAGMVAKEFAQLKVEQFAELGEPAEAITSFADNHAVDLIMMPTHGYGPFRTLLLGSVAAKVLHDAKCPVWTAAHGTELPSPDHLNPRRILCAVESAPKSMALLQWAADFGKTTDASLRMIHVVPGIESWPESLMNQEFERDMKAEARAQIAKMQESAGVDATLCVESGHVADAVRAEALRHNADLIVIGRGVLQETLGRLRSNAYGIIRQAPCPVLSL